ncbi:MAG: zf-TFIIB domain-containing protein [Akkermansiaceae bacterium]
MNHTCPRDQTTLKLKPESDHPLGECPECYGIWIPGERIDEILGKGQMLQLRSLCSVMKSDLPCPQGCGTVHQGKVGPVVVDLCQECSGLWLDHGELEALRKRRPVTPYQAPEKDEVLHPPGSIDAALLIPGLLMLID